MICNCESKTLATLRLKCVDGCWAVGDVRGFANSGVSPEISELGLLLAQRYGDGADFHKHQLGQAKGME